MSTSKRLKVYLMKAAPETDQALTVKNDPLQQVVGGNDKEQHQAEIQAEGHNSGAKPGDNEDRFITELSLLKIEATLVPVLTFEYCNLSVLWQHLQNPAQHAGIIFSSPRCISSITEAVTTCDMDNHWNTTLRQEWSLKYLYCIGPSTIAKAKQMFAPINVDSQIVTGHESHAESLADKMIEDNSQPILTLPLLYPCSALRRDVLQKKLANANVKFNQCIVYDSVMNPCLKSVLEKVSRELKTERDSTSVLCFFSPSGVKYVFQQLDVNILVNNLIHVVAIGPTTKSALDDFFSSRGISITVLQCKDPTPNSLVDVLQSHIIRKENDGHR
ncbi:unnamed protein product [Orchesella dallaii]|uniref:Tetrapyrrole biosynthesis uroporphyrinogen III synthase domain-containing protein n=1 Tax=Orchesella dallaii TaxID=48710 RepID=A0ABP1PVZ7_9HEXA